MLATTDPPSLRTQVLDYYRVQTEDAERMYGDARRRHKQQVRLDMIRSLAAEHVPPRARILDIGCGDGYAASYILEPADYLSYTGLDAAPLKLSKLRRRLRRARPVYGDAGSLPFDAGSFDCVLCLETLEHLCSPETALGDLRRVLSDDGTAIVSTPVDSPLQPLWNGFRARLRPSAPQAFDEHIQLFTSKSLDRLFEKAGLALRDKRFCAFAFPFDSQFQRLPYSVYAPLDKLLRVLPVERFGIGSSVGVAFGREYCVAVLRKA